MQEKTILITGGCGFIGSNASNYYSKKGYKVIVYDNLSRVGSKENLRWLKQDKNIIIIKGDIRNNNKLESTFRKYKPDLVLHLAAQVTMVTSVKKPREDFEINALGTFNVLEALRKEAPEAALLYTSTNKVYGEMNDLEVIEKEKRYEYKNFKGISEERNLDFQGPNGCSKGTGDQYTLDWARIYGLKTVVFRQSGIYGPHQFGIEEQGWLAWFINSLLFKRPVTIYGDGKQVRDVLYIDDVLEAYDAALSNINTTRGKAYNIGGGLDYSLSIWELFEIIEKLDNNKFKYSFGDWRPGDQKAYISEISKAKSDFNWSPKVSPQEGVQKLYNWINENKQSIIKSGVFPQNYPIVK
ncbi:GDP-mannose 4,6-dehydratase [bacterium]|jgi:CDP-paratose 2-epimerase|nr:GDP-mannose 4,6-dehydratase [bacterium]